MLKNVLTSSSLIALLFFCITVAGCNAVVEPESPLVTSLAPAYHIEAGQTLQLGSNVEVDFVEVLSDSRCPLGESCSQKGTVEASFIMKIDGVRTPFVIGGFVGPEGRQPADGRIAGYEVFLERLDPYPMENCDMSQPPRATLRFVK